MLRILYSFLLILILTALAVVFGDIHLGNLVKSQEEGKATLITIDSKHKSGKLSYNSVKPILETRCVACHAGADAPCQLQLSSYEGLQRGASKQSLYGIRLQPLPPTRLAIDGQTVDDWRAKGFFPVLNEKAQFPEINLNNSLVAKLLVLKRESTLPDADQVAEQFRASPQCPSLEEFGAFEQAHPFAGMPYTLPALSNAEQETLLNWLQDGAKNSQPNGVSEAALAEIGKWEQFLNDPSPQVQLTARYLYEHWFSAHLHFKGQPATEFFQLVRSKTAPGSVLEVVDSLHPYSAPDASAVYYRLRPVTDALVDKNHAVYELGDGKMARIKELFLKPEVTMAKAPAFAQEPYPQPFSAFKDLPIDARYQFLLDDAQFFLSAIFKSPALNQHFGLNGLHDQFWVAFLKPRAEDNPQTAQFLNENSPLLRFPASAEKSAGFFEWFGLKAAQKQYLEHKETFTQTVLLKTQAVAMDLLWNADGGSGDALLTVFRHDGNASVVKGLQGKAPRTAWVLDYPLLERLHYLLLAGFNAYGDSAHYLSTRLMFDLLRSEAENNFLQFLPKSVRKPVHDSWAPSMASQWLGAFYTPDFTAQAETAIPFQTQDYPKEFFGKIPKPVAIVPASPEPPAVSAPCPQEPCSPSSATPDPSAVVVQALPSPQPLPPPQPLPSSSQPSPRVDGFVRQLADLTGPELTALPELSFLRIKTANPDHDPVYTLIRNRQFSHVGALFGENPGRQADQDTLTVLPGLVGGYPQQFFNVAEDQLDAFVGYLQKSQDAAAVAGFYNEYGIGRRHPQFWEQVDAFNQMHRDGRPENAGLFDLSRYLGY